MSEHDLNRLREVIQQTRARDLGLDDVRPTGAPPAGRGAPGAPRALDAAPPGRAEAYRPGTAAAPRHGGLAAAARWWSARQERAARSRLGWSGAAPARRLGGWLLLVVAMTAVVWVAAVVRLAAVSGHLIASGDSAGLQAAAYQVRLLPDLAVLALIVVAVAPRAIAVPFVAAASLGTVPYPRLPGRFVPVDAARPLGRWAADLGTIWHGWAFWAALLLYLPLALALVSLAWTVLTRPPR